jgi:hypothetical protein
VLTLSITLVTRYPPALPNQQAGISCGDTSRRITVAKVICCSSTTEKCPSSVVKLESIKEILWAALFSLWLSTQ